MDEVIRDLSHRKYSFSILNLVYKGYEPTPSNHVTQGSYCHVGWKVFLMQEMYSLHMKNANVILSSKVSHLSPKPKQITKYLGNWHAGSIFVAEVHVYSAAN